MLGLASVIVISQALILMFAVHVLSAFKSFFVWVYVLDAILTFTGVWSSLRSLGVSVETGFAFLTLAPFGVVQTVTHASASLARLSPRRPIKMAASSVSVTFAPWYVTDSSSGVLIGWRLQVYLDFHTFQLNSEA